MDDDQGSLAVRLQALTWTLFVTSCLILGLRVWVHFFGARQETKRITPSGALILVALIIEFVRTVIISIACKHGLGQHSRLLADSERSKAVEYIMIIQGVAITSPMFGRIAFSAFLLRLVDRLNIWQRPVLWGVIAVQAVITVVTLIQIYSQCGLHITALWDPAVAAKSTCQDSMVQTVIGFVQSATNSACDLILTVLPGSIVWKLQQTLMKKVILCIFLSLSIFAFIASIIKAVAIGNLASRDDITYDFTILCFWVSIENNVIFIVASIPTLRPLMRTSKVSTSERQSGCTSGRIQRGGTVSACHYDVPLTSMGRHAEDEDTEHILKGERDAIVQKTEVKVVYTDSGSVSEEGSERDERTFGVRAYPA